MSKKIYLDNAATTEVHPEVLEAMLPYLKDYYGNPSSIHGLAKYARDAREHARASVAELINAEPKEIYFTAGGTESDNWALKSVAFGNRSKGNHIIVSKIEHHAGMNTCEFLGKNGFDITYLDVDEFGRVDPEDVGKAVRPETILISVMYANNEIGTIEPIAEIGKIAREHGILFHTDAVQAFGHVPIDVKAENIDLLSASGHKVYGPKGVGALYIRDGVKLEPLMHGGAQERGIRAGTENVPGIVGMGKAAEIAKRDMGEHIAKETELRDHMMHRLLTEVPFTKLNGHRSERLSGNVNIAFRFIEGESVLMLLNHRGVFVSTGSACASGSLDPSHVLLAIGLKHEVAHGSVRFTLSYKTTEGDIDEAVDAVKESVARLREMSPLYADHIKNGINKKEV
mgnify:CR=1 FL=1